MRTAPPPSSPISQSSSGKREVIVSLSREMESRVPRALLCKHPSRPSRKPFVREAGHHRGPGKRPLFGHSLQPRALHLHPHRADAGTNTAPGHEEGAETPSGMLRPRPCRSTLYPLPSPSHSASVGLARAMQAWTGETGKKKKYLPKGERDARVSVS